MKVFFTSLTGKTRKFISKTEFNDTAQEFKKGDLFKIDEPFVLVVYTFGFGKVPDGVRELLEYERNFEYLRGVASSGNINWGDNFGRAGITLSELYNVPLLLRFQLDGTSNDVIEFDNKVKGLM